MRTNKKNLLLASVTALALLAPGASLAADAAAAPEPAKAQSNLPAIIVTTVKREKITDIVRASGLVSEVELVSVQPKIEGQAVETLEAQVGDRVEKDQVLAMLSQTALELKKSQLQASRASAEAAIAQAQAQVAEAQAAAAEADRQAERATTLAGKGIGPKATAEQAQTSAETAAARVNSAQQAAKAAQAQVNVIDAQLADIDLQLSRTQIKAPVGGVIVERNAQVGAIASAAGQPMFSLLKDGELELRADVAEQDLLRLAAGQKATIRVAGVREPISGTVRIVEPTVNMQTRLGRVRIVIDQPEKVRWGMFADAEIVVAEHESLIAPVSAIGLDANGATALKVENGVVDLIPVETGIREADRVEILSGLEEGDQIVAKAGAFVRDGDRINPVMQDKVAASN